MMERGLTTEAFPTFKCSVRARWAPVLLSPIDGSLERLVIGIAVVSDDDFHLELANALDRLRCLYAREAEGVVYAIQVAAERLRNDLAVRAIDALLHPKIGVSSVTIGDLREAEGISLEMIGASWMRSLSSLYQDAGLHVHHELPALVAEAALPREQGDRLPALVFGYVAEHRDSLVQYFRSDLRLQKVRRMTGRSHEVMIDFSGSRVVANFGTLQSGGIARSMNLIKRRLWDLKVERDREASSLSHRLHEMILQAPASDDPQVTPKQLANINEALCALEQQADQEELRLRALPTVTAIGNHLLQLEAA